MQGGTGLILGQGTEVFLQKIPLGSYTHLKRVINIFTVLILVMFPWMDTESKAYQIIHFKCVKFIVNKAAEEFVP